MAYSWEHRLIWRPKPVVLMLGHEHGRFLSAHADGLRALTGGAADYLRQLILCLCKRPGHIPLLMAIQDGYLAHLNRIFKPMFPFRFYSNRGSGIE